MVIDGLEYRDRSKHRPFGGCRKATVEELDEHA